MLAMNGYRNNECPNLVHQKNTCFACQLCFSVPLMLEILLTINVQWIELRETHGNLHDFAFIFCNL